MYEFSVFFELHLFSSFIDFGKLDRDRDELEVDEHWAAFTATSRQKNSNSDVKKLWGDRSLRTRSGEIESRKIEVEDRSRGESLGTSSPGDRIFDKKVEEDREYSANEKEKRVYWSQSWSGLVV